MCHPPLELGELAEDSIHLIWVPLQVSWKPQERRLLLFRETKRGPVDPSSLACMFPGKGRADLVASKKEHHCCVWLVCRPQSRKGLSQAASGQEE